MGARVPAVLEGTGVGVGNADGQVPEMAIHDAPGRPDLDADRIPPAVQFEPGHHIVPVVGTGLLVVHPETDAFRICVAAEAPVARAEARIADVGPLADRVAPYARGMGPPPEVDVAVVAFEDEVVSRAGKDRIVARIVAEDVLQEVHVLHLVPAVLGVEGAARRALARKREEVPLEQHVLHGGGRIPDAAAVLEAAVPHHAVDGDAEGRQRKRRSRCGLRAFVLYRNPEERRPVGDPHLAVLPGRFGRNELFRRVVPGDGHLPGARHAPLVAEVLRDLEPAQALPEDFVERLEVRRKAELVRRVDIARPRVKAARRELRESLEEKRQSALRVGADSVLTAVARYVDDLHALDRAVPRVAADLKAGGPLRVVRRVRVVVRPVVALERPADEMRVDRARKAHQHRTRPRETVLLQRRLAEVKRHAARDKHGIGPCDPVGARQHHEPAEARRGLFVQELLEPFRRRNGRRLGGGLVVARVVDDLRLLPRLPGKPPRLRIKRHRHGVARRPRALLLHDLRSAVRLEIDDLLDVAVVADAVLREVRFRHPVDLVRGNREIRGGYDAEVVDDAVRLAPLRVPCPDAHLVLADAKSAEVERGVAALQILERKDLGRSAFQPILEEGGEPVRIVEEADLRGVEVRHEETDLYVLARRNRRRHIVRRDVGILQPLRRLVALLLLQSPFHDRRVREIAGEHRLGESGKNGKGENGRRYGTADHPRQRHIRHR